MIRRKRKAQLWTPTVQTTGWAESTLAEQAWVEARGAAVRWAIVGAIVGVLVGLIAFAPASWLASAIASASGHRLVLADARGTIWSGSAVTVLAGGPDSRDATYLPGRLEWTLDIPVALSARANPDHLAQVLANLLQNAVRYTPDGGAITIRAEERPSDVLVSVRNSGATIAADELPKVFERFYRVDRSRDRRSGGAGIGLAIVKQLVETGGGRVGAESADGRTTFWFSLPRG